MHLKMTEILNKIMLLHGFLLIIGVCIVTTSIEVSSLTNGFVFNGGYRTRLIGKTNPEQDFKPRETPSTLKLNAFTVLCSILLGLYV